MTNQSPPQFPGGSDEDDRRLSVSFREIISSTPFKYLSFIVVFLVLVLVPISFSYVVRSPHAQGCARGSNHPRMSFLPALLTSHLSREKERMLSYSRCLPHKFFLPRVIFLFNSFFPWMCDGGWSLDVQDYFEYGLKQRKSTGKVDTSKVYTSGRYVLGRVQSCVPPKQWQPPAFSFTRLTRLSSDSSLVSHLSTLGWCKLNSVDP